MNQSPHREHRARMKERFLKHGLDTFHDHEVLELFLYYSIPRIDTNPIAHRLIDTFGSFYAVLEAPKEALEAVNGVGENTVTLLLLFRQMMNRYATDKQEHELQHACMDTSEVIGKYLQPRFIGLHEEILVVMATDMKGKILGVEEISRGTTRATSVSIRKIAEFAFRYQAASIILSHNHPGGTAYPSYDDMHTTQAVQSALEPLGVTVRDHIIVADDEFVSLRDSGLMQYTNMKSISQQEFPENLRKQWEEQRCAGNLTKITRIEGE